MHGRFDFLVWLTLGVMLVLGIVMIRVVEAQTIAFADPQGSLRLRYPAGWLPAPESAALLEVADPLTGAAVPTRLVVTREPARSSQTLEETAADMILARSRELAMYRPLGEQALSVAGRQALGVEYAFVADPYASAVGARRVPVVIRGIEVLVPAGPTIYHIDFRAPADIFDRERTTLDRILREVRL